MNTTVISTIGVCIAALSLVFTVIVTTRQQSGDGIARQIKYALSEFKDQLVDQLKKQFVDKETHDLQMQLIRKDIGFLDSRTSRNTEHIGSIYRKSGEDPPSNPG